MRSRDRLTSSLPGEGAGGAAVGRMWDRAGYGVFFQEVRRRRGDKSVTREMAKTFALRLRPQNLHLSSSFNMIDFRLVDRHLGYGVGPRFADTPVN